MCVSGRLLASGRLRSGPLEGLLRDASCPALSVYFIRDAKLHIAVSTSPHQIKSGVMRAVSESAERRSTPLLAYRITAIVMTASNVPRSLAVDQLHFFHSTAQGEALRRAGEHT